MPENDVDMSVLDKLIEITKQQRKLDEFRAKAEAKKDKVDAAVYRRVVDDYKTRDADLEKEAQPLKAQARVEYDKLRVLFDGVNEREVKARYDKQELEFRHEVGEMDAAQLATQLKAPTAILEECQAELAGLQKQKARFLEAFDEDELERPAPASSRPATPAPAPAPESKAVTGVQEAPELGDATIMGPRVDINILSAAASPSKTAPPPLPVPPPLTPSKPAPPPAAAAKAPVPSQATPKPAPPSLAPPKPPPPSYSPKAAPPADDQAEEYTFVLPEGVLLGDGKQEFRLSAVNYIGRSDDNQIRITSNGVSRKHALIAADKTAFIIRDLKSQNGTFVNDDQIDERVLKDGDVIKLGEAELVFKLTKKGS